MRMARLAEPLMTDGGTFMTMSYYGAEKASGTIYVDGRANILD